ncbi:MAG: hypothetical protein ACPGVU_26265 [Limisphaerales bacterium]
MTVCSHAAVAPKVIWQQGDGGPCRDSNTQVAVGSDDYPVRICEWVTREIYRPKEKRKVWFDSFVAKYNSSGNEEWNLTASGTGSFSLRKLAVTSDNNIYVAGWFAGNVEWGDEH